MHHKAYNSKCKIQETYDTLSKLPYLLNKSYITFTSLTCTSSCRWFAHSGVESLSPPSLRYGAIPKIQKDIENMMIVLILFYYLCYLP